MNKLQPTSPSSLTTTKREKPSFAAMTAGKAMFAAIGALAMISEGNKIITRNDVDDPADYISGELAKAFSNMLNDMEVKTSELVVSSTKASDLSRYYSESDYVIDVQTINWSLVYFPTDWDSYKVIYSAKLRVIDTRTRTQVAEGYCSRDPEQDASSPSYDMLLADNAERLKEELMIAANYCIGEFKEKVLKVKT